MFKDHSGGTQETNWLLGIKSGSASFKTNTFLLFYLSALRKLLFFMKSPEREPKSAKHVIVLKENDGF